MSATWFARARDVDLNLLQDVKFSTLTRVRNYNRPSALSVTGQLDNLRPLLRPDRGIDVVDEQGRRQFSGRITGIRRIGKDRAGSNRGELTFVSDSAHLWWRLCYPRPSAAWEAQTDAYDVQTGPTETRILHYVDYNLGPHTWKAPAIGVDPGTGAMFSPFTNLVPSRKKRVQSVAVDDVTGDLFVAQADDGDSDAGTPDSLYISHWVDGSEASTMTLPKGGHGDQLVISRVKGKVHCTFRYRGLSGSHDVSGTWVRIPYVADKTWKAAEALAYKVAAPVYYRGGTQARPVAPFRTKPDRTGWFQGEAFYDGTFYRLYGVPYGNSGPTGSNAAMPARIDVIRAGVVQRTIDASQLGRGAGNLPIDGRLEPEGLSIIVRAGQPCLLVGVSTGTGNTLQHRLWTYPLKPGADTQLDRRLPNLRIPVSQGRGSTGKTSARFEVLGQLVADLAELDDLAVDVVLSYEGFTPHLDLVITPAPDLTGSIRVGTSDQGGPIVVGDEWFYNLELPADTAVTTVLSAAGGEGTTRLLNSLTDFTTQSLWGNVRIERLLDQSSSDDPTEIAEGMATALLDGAGAAEVSIPLGSSSVELGGADVPLGSKIAASLDGELITERIRQVTTEVKNASGEPTFKTTAVLGSPDAGIQSPTQKRLAKMLRRLQTQEAR